MMFSTWLFPAFVIVITVLIALGLTALLRIVIPKAVLKQKNEIAAAIHIAISTMYAILISFILAGVWERWSVLDQNIETEANSLLELDQSAARLPDSTHTIIRERIRSYSQWVVDSAWQLLAEGKRYRSASYAALWSAVEAVPDSTDRDRLWVQSAYQTLQTIDKARNQRLFYSKSTVPSLLWVFLIVGGLITILSTVFFDVEHHLTHVALVGALTTIITLVLYMIVEIDHPFSGLSQVSPDAFRDVLELLK